MELKKAIEITKEHIRVGKGMILTNGVPEALEMILEKYEVTEKALEKACEFFYTQWNCPLDTEEDCSTKQKTIECWKKYWLQKAGR